MDSFGRLCLVFISLSFVGIVCPEIEVRDWCVQNTSVTCNAACSEALPSLPNFPGSYFACLEPTTTERTTTTELETTGVTTDVTGTDFTATDITGTDVTATDVTVTEITVTEITVTEVTPTEITPTEVTPTEVTPTEVTPTEVTRSFPTSSSATGICCNTHTTEPPETTTIPGPGSGTTAITGGISPNVLRSATIGTGAVSALLYISVVLCLCYVLVKNAVRHNKVHPDTQERNDEGQESETENGQPSSETEQPVPSSFQKMLQGSLTIGVLQVQVWLIFITVGLAVIFILIIIGVVLAVMTNHIASLVIFAICIVISLAYFVLLVAVKMMYDKPKKQHDEEDVCLENCPEKTFPFPNEGLKPINEDRPIENERPSSASSSKAGRVVTTPHGENPKENSDDRNRKISSGSQAGDTTLLVTVDTDTMYRKPRKKKKKRASRPSIELGELRLPGARSSYGHIYNEHTT